MDYYEEVTSMPLEDGGTEIEVTSAASDGFESFYSAIDLSPEAAGAIIMATFAALIIGYVLNSIFLSMVFKKAGVPSWQAWVPILNIWKTLEIGGKNGAWVFVSLVPFVGSIAFLIFIIMAYQNINLKMGYGTGMTVLALVFPFIWLIILALSKNQWNPNLGQPSLAGTKPGSQDDSQGGAESSDSYPAAEVVSETETVVEAPTPAPVAEPEAAHQQVVTPSMSNDVIPPAHPENAPAEGVEKNEDL